MQQITARGPPPRRRRSMQKSRQAGCRFLRLGPVRLTQINDVRPWLNPNGVWPAGATPVKPGRPGPASVRSAGPVRSPSPQDQSRWRVRQPAGPPKPPSAASKAAAMCGGFWRSNTTKLFAVESPGPAPWSPRAACRLDAMPLAPRCWQFPQTPGVRHRCEPNAPSRGTPRQSRDNLPTYPSPSPRFATPT